MKRSKKLKILCCQHMENGSILDRLWTSVIPGYEDHQLIIESSSSTY